MRLAVIPARGGSKRIPRKNVLPFRGVPMIAWSIKAAEKSECFDRIIVSTDDEEIASIALRFGAEAPFYRPADLASDSCGTVPVIAHAIEFHNSLHANATEVCCIYPTAPLIHSTDLQRGLRLLLDRQCDFSVSVTSFASPIQRAFRITRAETLEMFDTRFAVTRSQDLEPAFHDAGQFYWGRTASWLNNRAIFSSVCAPLMVERWRVHDLNTLEDLHVLESLLG